MVAYQCGVCGRTHEELPHDLAYKWPPEYLRIPAAERERRVTTSADFCVIDEQQFLIRGVLALPIREAAETTDAEFRWGTWVLLQKPDFVRYLELYEEEQPGRVTLLGHLAGGIRGYADSHMLPVRVEIQPGGKRPRFLVISEDHPLGQDQRAGIPEAQVHQFIEAVMSGHVTPKTDSAGQGKRMGSVLDYFRKRSEPKPPPE